MPVHMLNQYCKAACLPVSFNSAPSAGPDDDPNRSAEFGIQRNRGRKVDVTFVGRSDLRMHSATGGRQGPNRAGGWRIELVTR